MMNMRNARGFSMIELLVAVLVMGMAFWASPVGRW
jgi:prepilin-type N-terminal cleavage/methylation domain-containing protein